MKWTVLIKTCKQVVMDLGSSAGHGPPFGMRRVPLDHFRVILMMGEINPIRRGQVSRGRNPVRAVNKCNYRASSHFRMILKKLQAPSTVDNGPGIL